MAWNLNWKKLKLKLADRRVILVITLFDLLLFATLTFMLEEHYSFYNAAYNSLCDLTFAHCDNGYGLWTKISSLTTIIGTWGALAFIASMALQAFMEGGKRKMESDIMKMKDHYIIAGYGALGKTVAEVFQNQSLDYVVIDLNAKVVEKLNMQGVKAIEGDALEPDILKKAGVAKAKGLIASLGTDSNNVFMTLTAKELNPNIIISTRAFTEGAINKLHRAGAELIVVPEIIGGLELARTLLNLEESHIQNLISKSKIYDRKQVKKV
jgi:voltage-gated potassium channel